jgi:signal transduction histidine kinase
VAPGSGRPAAKRERVSQRFIRPACIVLLLAAFALDLVTPQLFVAAILLNAPIALSSLALDRRFTQVLIVAALAANLAAGYANGVTDGYHWDPVALGDRVIAGLSFLLVGVLSIATQTAAKRAGELTARQDRATREQVVGRAVEAIGASVNAELIERAIAREACVAFDADRTWFFAFDPSTTSPSTYAASAGIVDVTVMHTRPAAEVLSLLERIGSRRDPVAVTGSDPLGRLLLDTLGVEYAVAVTIADREAPFGVLVVGRSSESFDWAPEEMLRYFAQQAAIALARAALFAQLGARNDELARVNAALVERSDVIRDIVFAMSHDLRTPLAAAGMTMRQAVAGAFGPLPPAYVDILRRTIASNDELQRLAETLLLVSRYESGDRSMRREPVDVCVVATEVVADLEPMWKEKGVSVRVAGGDCPLVPADPSELRRALVNLTANAVKFTPAGGSVVVDVGRSGDRATTRVEDTGYGVPEQARSHLFERLQQAPGTAGAGSGLGLYIVKLIAESHGGAVHYAPRDGGGSVFSLELPIAQTPVTA